MESVFILLKGSGLVVTQTCTLIVNQPLPLFGLDQLFNLATPQFSYILIRIILVLTFVVACLIK